MVKLWRNIGVILLLLILPLRISQQRGCSGAECREPSSDAGRTQLRKPQGGHGYQLDQNENFKQFGQTKSSKNWGRNNRNSG